MSDTRIITANEAAAQAAALSRVQMIAAYPITPQTPVTEALAAMVESGRLKAEYITVESEHSAMAAVVAAAQVGARVFTATSANGLLYMHEMLHWAAGSRLPVVMACVNRGVGAPWTILNDQQDSISQRDTGWMQLYCRNSQEVLDTIIQAYAIATRSRIPVMVCYDGFVLSHISTPVEIPVQEDVDRFLPPPNESPTLDPADFANVNPLILSEPRESPDHEMMPGYMELRNRLQQDILAALDTIESVDEQFKSILGRGWGGTAWTYLMEDAEHVIVTMGSLASESTIAADEMRQRGLRVGVVGVKAYRPFPTTRLTKLLRDRESVIVFEKDVSFGYGGALATDLKATLFDAGLSPRFSSFIAGLGGRDVRPDQIVDSATNAILDKPTPAWVNMKA